MDGNNVKKILLGIFILALFLRILAVVTQPESKKMPYSDAKNYDGLAMSIVSGQGFSELIAGEMVPAMRRTPLYPMFLASIYAIFGHNYMAVKIIQAFLGALLCIIVFFIADSLYNNKIIGLISCFGVAIYKPFFWGFFYYGGPALLLTEYFYMFILGLAILTLVLFIKKEDKRFGILSGILIGLAILTRPEFVLFPMVLFFYLYFTERFSIKKFCRRYIVIYVFILLTMAPWIVRNFIISKTFVPLSSVYGAMNFWLGNNDSAKGGWANPDNYQLLLHMKDISEQERQKIFFRKTIEALKNNPKRIPMLLIKKILIHWAPFEEGFKVFNPYYAVILLFASIAIIFFRRYSISENILLIIFISTTLLAVILWGEPRWRYPYEFCLIIFASLTIDKIFTAIHQRKALSYGR